MIKEITAYSYHGILLSNQNEQPIIHTVCVELKPEIIDAQQKELVPLVLKHGGIYDGWGTYFEDPNSTDDEYGDDGEFFDEEDEEDIR